MKTAVCQRCGRKIHPAGKCPCCGCAGPFREVESTDCIHENAAEVYERLGELLKNGSFDELLETSRLILRWMPSKSDVFWYRLLAKNQCRCDAELIRKGVCLEDSADYHNAVQYASSDESEVYSTVYELVQCIRKKLMRSTVEHEYAEKRALPTLSAQTAVDNEIDLQRKKIFGLWSQLEKTEFEISIVEQNFKLLLKEHTDTLQGAKAEAEELKTEIFKLASCGYEDLHRYQVRLGNALSQSEQGKDEIDTIKKGHPWISRFSELTKQRDQLCVTIYRELAGLKSTETRARSLIAENEKIEQKHQSARQSLIGYDFRAVYSLLGAQKFEEIITEAGHEVAGTPKNV